ncbi:MAG TPA: hypothetical protein VGD07_04425 [Methylomirabilota bacterium]
MRGFESTPADLRALLPQRISRLGLKLEGSPVERYVQMLYRELERKGLRHFRPPCYLTDEWGCPDGEPIIGIPFYLADPKLARLEQEIDDLEDEREIRMYLRHEAGHAFNHPVLIEQYIEGREIYVGVIGNAEAEALPPVELDLSHLPKGTPRIAGAEVKWQEGTRAYRGSRARVPTDLPAPVVEALQGAAVTAFQTLHLRDYARFDFRITPDGAAYLIEANPNPYLHSTAEFIRAARASGRTYPGTIREIVGLALSRYGLSV